MTILQRIIGGMYFILGLWCTFAAQRAANTLGYTFKNETGFSEFVTVYGGLQVGLGLALILTSLKKEWQPGAYVFAMIFSIILPIYRTLTFPFYEVEPLAYILCIFEYVIALILVIFFVKNRKAK